MPACAGMTTDCALNLRPSAWESLPDPQIAQMFAEGQLYICAVCDIFG